MRLTPLFPAALTLVLLACTRPDINQPVDTFVCVARPGDLSSTRAPEARGDLFGSPAAGLTAAALFLNGANVLAGNFPDLRSDRLRSSDQTKDLVHA